MPPSTQPPAVLARQLSREYRMGESTIRAVDGISLAIAAGEFVALLGPSGSGKSTLLNLIGGLDRTSSGTLQVMGREVSGMGGEELARYRRHTVGMVFQSFNLVPTMTVLENVELPMIFAEVERTERRRRANEALERVGLAARMRHRPTELSGGEQQRASIARALVNRPSLLLADEPTGNLDTRTGDEVMRFLEEFHSAGMTVLLVTHERALAERHAKRLLTLADGKLVADTFADGDKAPANAGGTQ